MVPVSGTIQGAHRQADHAVRFEWGPTGAEAVPGLVEALKGHTQAIRK